MTKGFVEGVKCKVGGHIVLRPKRCNDGYEQQQQQQNYIID